MLVVVLAGELELELQAVEVARQTGEEGLDIGIGGVGPVLRQELAPGGELVGVGAQAFEGSQAALEPAALLEDGSALRGVVPELAVFELVVDLGQAPF